MLLRSNKIVFILAKTNRRSFTLLFSFFCLLATGWVQASEPIAPLPASIPTDASKVALGKKLFFDKRLSADNTISCASCHDLDKGFGTDLKATSSGINGQTGTRNSPTVFNAALNFTQFWDGRAKDLAAQAKEPVVNPIEMGMASWDDALVKLKEDPYYEQAFQQIYQTSITIDGATEALAEFQKTLITPNAPFDQYLKGDQTAINDQQKKGYGLFKAYGCVSCHQGQNVGGNMFQKFGVLKDISLQYGSLNKDLGRYNVTGNEWDKRVFKVPSLRLAAVTPPYFHDGSIGTLQEAVDVMIEFQLGREVPLEDRQAIVAFIESLVGELPEGVN